MSCNKGLLQRTKILDEYDDDYNCLEEKYLTSFPEANFESIYVCESEFYNEIYEFLLDEAIENDDHYIFRKEFDWEEMSYYRFEINGQNVLDYNYDEYSCGNWSEDINKVLSALFED